MIKVENGSVQLYCSKEDLTEIVTEADLTANQASQVIIGADLSMLFHCLVDRYSIDGAAKLWTTAVEAYKHVVMKGDSCNEDN